MEFGDDQIERTPIQSAYERLHVGDVFELRLRKFAAQLALDQGAVIGIVVADHDPLWRVEGENQSVNAVSQRFSGERFNQIQSRAQIVSLFHLVGHLPRGE